MNWRDRRILWGLALVAGTAITANLATWFLENFERVTEEATIGYSKAARRNPLLAAERLLERLDYPVTRASSATLWRALPPPDETLVVYRFRPPTAPERREALRRWIEKGGRLVAGIERGAELAGGVFESRRVSVELSEAEGGAETRFDHPAHPRALTISPGTRRTLVLDPPPDAVWAKGDAGPRIAAYQVGRGELILVSDAAFFGNRAIGSADNALALLLLAGLPERGRIWLASDVDMPPLHRLLWHKAPELVIAAALTLGLWFWSMGGVIGPRAAPAARARRDLGEHLQAAAALLWRKRRGKALFERNQQRIEQAWLVRHPRLQGLSLRQRSRWIAARTGVGEGEVQRALYAPMGNVSDFLHSSRVQQQLHSYLKGTEQ